MQRFMMLRIAAATSAAVVVLLLVGYVGVRRGQAQRLTIFGLAPSWKLTDQLERPVTSDELRGKAVVANFIYTNCKDICPLLSIRMQALQERLQQEKLLGTDVQLLSFTVDPKRDTTAVLRKYAERHRADPQAWRFLTGPEEVVKPLIVDGFKLGAQALPPQTPTPDEQHPSATAEPGYDVMHSGRFVLIDPQGQIRAYYDGRDLDLDRVVQDIRQVLR